LAAGTVVFVLAGCGGGSKEEAVSPVQTNEADWKAVADALGRPGKLADGTVYRVSFPRSDLSVRSRGVNVEPGLALGSYAAFARYPDTTMVMGDLVVTEQELQRLTSALQDNGVSQTAVHKHLLEHSPAVWWAHFEAEGQDPGALARAVRAALDRTATPPAAGDSASDGQPGLDTAAIDAALGTRGSAEDGIYKFSFARKRG